MFRRRPLAALLASILAAFAVAASSWAGAPTPLDYTRDVRPILSKNCFPCHGADPAKREADLRLDQLETVGDVRGAGEVITAGKVDESELVARITESDPDLRMPPADSGKTLKPDEIEILRRWIAEGAEYKKHWAFVAPTRPAVPQVSDASWVKNPIDAFILARLEKEGLKPSPPADPATLLRRLSLDLIGLPPNIAEVDAYLADKNSDATAKQIERLLASPHYGERWGRLWLDAARYADSDGFEKDKPRFVWMYRDWVIKALNQDLPYDEFLIEQIAGDLLPNPTQNQRVATGFLRNSMINEEGGIDPEQFRMEAMYDRMDAIGKAMLGLTIQCGQCHTHKYDPLTQTDYYRMFACINNCDEGQLTTYTDVEQAEWRRTARLVRRLEDRLRADNPDWSQRMAAWEASVKNYQPEWTIVRPKVDGTGDQKLYALDDGSILAQGYAPTQHETHVAADAPLPKITAIRLELLNDPNLPRGGPGRSIYGTCALTDFKAYGVPLEETSGEATFSEGEKLDPKTQLKIKSATADVNPPDRELEKIFDDKSGKRRITGHIDYAIDGNDLTAWTNDNGPGRSNVPSKAVFVLDKPLETKTGVRITFTLRQVHGGWNSDDNQNNNFGRFRYSVTAAEKPVADPVPADVRKILVIPADQRTPEQIDEVFSYWRTTVADWAETNRRLDALWQSHPQGVTQLVLTERTTPRKTHRLERGNFLKPAEEVQPGVPEFLHQLAESDAQAPARLRFGHWLVDRRSSTTARAIVNRIWQAYFGAGLVGTAEDLGTQGDYPTHPELLDWLAVELMDNGWSLKHIHRLIVSSAAYQQSSVATPGLIAADPENKLLARGPRYRVDAELVRDIALATSGLLTRTIGGPSVYPPAPEFLFEPPASYGPKTWAYDTGRDKYRRAMYTFRFRSVPYPMLQNFDAPTGDFACVRRVRSNTPLQALTTLNEPLFLEAARALARKVVAEGGANDAARLRYAVRTCLAREPHADELKVLTEFLLAQKARFNKEGADPSALLADENAPRIETPAGLSTNDLAAWTATARVVLNLDETITKE
jgi:hypothetical protein